MPETLEDIYNAKDWVWVILALKKFCENPTDDLHRKKLTENIVNNLVGSSIHTQYKLEEFIDKKFFNTLFWTALFAFLKKTYEEIQEEEAMCYAAGGAGRNDSVRVPCTIFRF